MAHVILQKLIMIAMELSLRFDGDNVCDELEVLVVR